MDPQQRLLLTTAWEAIERAGIPRDDLRGSKTGVFVGLMHHDYVNCYAPSPERYDGHVVTGTSASVASGRVAYTFGLEGAAVTVDTACSSSLVALHLACQSLRQGECDLALAGGASVMATPAIFLEFSRQRAMSTDGYCKPFSASADGTAWGEGVGMIALERLSDAVANGHPVLALVRGSAVNQDGASNGLTAPNGPSQERVILQALASAGLGTADVDLVEAHGTGTVLGDPIEVGALAATYGRGRSVDKPLWLGSIKSNINHTQAAAGVAGVIKLVMAMQHSAMPATLGCDDLSPHMDWSTGEIKVLSQSRKWKANGRPRRSAVSSFGISGTNAHVILEESPALNRPDKVPSAECLIPVQLSAFDNESLVRCAARLGQHIRKNPDLQLNAMAGVLSRRSPLPYRLAVPVDDRAQLIACLENIGGAEDDCKVQRSFADLTSHRTVFVCPGQGSQWPKMAIELLEQSPVFKSRMDECAAALAPHVDWSLLDVLRQGANTLERLDVLQPVLWAMSVSLAEVWRSIGVAPDAVVGHSQGEIVAAYLSGALTLEQAAKVSALRGRLVLQLDGHSEMSSVALSEEEAKARIDRSGLAIEIAVVNSSRGVAVGGKPSELDAFEQLLIADDVRVRRIARAYASHSSHVEPVRDELLEALNDLTPKEGSIPFFSTVTAKKQPTTELGASYWYDNLRNTVRFSDTVEALRHDGYTAFIELSPHPLLTAAIEDSISIDGGPGLVVGSLRRDEGGMGSIVASATEAFLQGLDIDWSSLIEHPQEPTKVPTYAFSENRYWSKASGPVGEVGNVGMDATGHPIMRAQTSLGRDGEILWTGRVTATSHTWTEDHAVEGTVLLPGTALVELAAFAGCESGCPVVAELVLEKPVIIPAEGHVDLQLTVGPRDENSDSRPIEMFGRLAGESNKWIRHMHGAVHAERRQQDHLVVWPPDGAIGESVGQLYDELFTAGFEYGPTFQGVKKVWRYGDDLYVETELPHEIADDAFLIHPVLFDMALQVLGPNTFSGDGPGRLPFAWQDVQFGSPIGSVIRTRLTPNGTDAYSVELWNEFGAPIGRVGNLVLRPVDKAALATHSPATETTLHQLEWRGTDKSSSTEPLAYCLLNGNSSTFTNNLVQSDPDVQCFRNIDQLRAATATGNRFKTVLLGVGDSDSSTTFECIRDHVDWLRQLVQEWLADEDFLATKLAFVTCKATSPDLANDLEDLVGAAIWGFVRTCQTEHPDRFLLVDVDNNPASLDAICDALGSGESQLAIRAGELRVPRLRRGTRLALEPPIGADNWRLDTTGKGTLANLALVEAPDVAAPLGSTEVRVAVRAAGINFRDIMVSLGLVDLREGEANFGSEGAGIVIEVGSAVSQLNVGDRVFGIFPGAFGPVAIADSRLIGRLPVQWSFSEGASVPITFLTAWHGLVELGDLQAGQSVLIHAAAGGVGLAAVQIARYLGADIFVTASSGKWQLLRDLGIPDTHISTSRSDAFKEQFLSITDGCGVDVVLNSLTGELVDASLALLPQGGRFLEIGKTDKRHPDKVAENYPGVEYLLYDLLDTGPVRLAEMLAEVLVLFEQKVLVPCPITACDVRLAPDIFRHMSQGKHTGKMVLTFPREPDPEGTVLITGATGMIGRLVALQLVATGVRHLLLVSRSGQTAAGAVELKDELIGLGAQVKVVSCDVSDREALADTLADIPDAHPLTGVVHAAGVLDDAVVSSLDTEQIERVMRPKVGAALHLDALTRDLDLAFFILFSSMAGVLGTAGQANYAAANSFLDGLARVRRSSGQAAQSFTWGLWEGSGGMLDHLDARDYGRMHALGLSPMIPAEAIDLFTKGMTHADAVLAPAKFNAGALRRPDSPVLLNEIQNASRRRRVATPHLSSMSLVDTLLAQPEAEQRRRITDLVRKHAAEILGHEDEIDSRRSFKDLGFDSLTAIELRNRIGSSTGVRFSPALVFDHPTVQSLADFLHSELLVSALSAAPPTVVIPPTRSDEPLAVVGVGCRFPGGVVSADGLWDLVAGGVDAVGGFPV